MERKDLLKANVKIFKSQGAALDKYAKKTVKVNIGTEFKTLILSSVEVWIHCRRILHKQGPVHLFNGGIPFLMPWIIDHSPG